MPLGTYRVIPADDLNLDASQIIPWKAGMTLAEQRVFVLRLHGSSVRFHAREQARRDRHGVDVYRLMYAHYARQRFAVCGVPQLLWESQLSCWRCIYPCQL